MKLDMRKGDLSWPQYVWALLPFGLIAIGGPLLGGLCGGAVAGMNVNVMKGGMGAGQKYVVTGLATTAAVAGYVVVAALIVLVTGLEKRPIGHSLIAILE